MSKGKPSYRQLVERLAKAEPIVEALKHHEVDAVVGEEKIAFLLLRKVEEAWQESHGEFSAMFNLDGIGMIQADTPDFRFTRVNAKFCEISGYSAEELLSKTYVTLTHPSDRTPDLKEVARVIRGKTDSLSIEKRCVRKDGLVIWVAVHGFALRDHSGRAVRIMAMVEDITSRKHAEQQLRDVQEQMKNKLKEWTTELSRMLRPLQSRVATRNANQMIRNIHDFIDRSIGPTGDRAPAGPSKPKARAKNPPRKKARRAPDRKSTDQPRSRRR